MEHQYRRSGALNLFAAFNTRTGQVIGRTFERRSINNIDQWNRQAHPFNLTSKSVAKIMAKAPRP